MTDPELLAPANGTDQRLDLLIGEIRALRSLLTPVAAVEPTDGETIELREPVAAANGATTEKPRRRR